MSRSGGTAVQDVQTVNRCAPFKPLKEPNGSKRWTGFRGSKRSIETRAAAIQPRVGPATSRFGERGHQKIILKELTVFAVEEGRSGSSAIGRQIRIFQRLDAVINLFLQLPQLLQGSFSQDCEVSGAFR